MPFPAAVHTSRWCAAATPPAVYLTFGCSKLTVWVKNRSSQSAVEGRRPPVDGNIPSNIIGTPTPRGGQLCPYVRKIGATIGKYIVYFYAVQYLHVRRHVSYRCKQSSIDVDKWSGGGILTSLRQIFQLAREL